MSFPHVLRPAKLLAAGAAAACTVTLLAAPALAHVTVNPKTAAPGAWSTFAFQVPNERDNADTTELEVFFPTDHPIPSVSVEPVPGWTIHIQKQKLATPIRTDDGTVTEAVSAVTWSGGHIAPGQFQSFDVEMGPLPTGVRTLYFKAIQTYSDGTVVRWIDLPSAGGGEPAHPAPALTLSAATASPAAATPAKSASTAPALAVGVAGLVFGLAGLAVGGVALRRSRRGDAS